MGLKRRTKERAQREYLKRVPKKSAKRECLKKGPSEAFIEDLHREPLERNLRVGLKRGTKERD